MGIPYQIKCVIARPDPIAFRVAERIGEIGVATVVTYEYEWCGCGLLNGIIRFYGRLL